MAARFDLGAAAPDAADRPGGGDVPQRVPVDQHQVGPAAGLDHAAVGQPEVAGGPRGGGAQRVHGGQPGLDQQLELVVQAAAVADRGRPGGLGVGVGSGQDRHPGLVHDGDAVPGRGVVAIRGRPRDAFHHDQRRDQDAASPHGVGRGRLVQGLVQRDMGEDADLRPLRHLHRHPRRGMRHAEPAVLAGGDRQRVQRGLVMAGGGVADDDLDVVRAFRHPVGHERPGLIGAGQQAARADDGDVRVRAARRDGRRARAADVGQPGHVAQRVHQLGRCARHVQGGGDAEASQLLERAPVPQVHVGVDEPGQQHAALAVDDLGAAQVGTDPAALDDHRVRGLQLPAIEHADVRHGGPAGSAAHGRLLVFFPLGSILSSPWAVVHRAE